MDEGMRERVIQRADSAASGIETIAVGLAYIGGGVFALTMIIALSWTSQAHVVSQLNQTYGVNSPTTLNYTKTSTELNGGFPPLVLLGVLLLVFIAIIGFLIGAWRNPGNDGINSYG